jgi:hypothetical protein
VRTVHYRSPNVAKILIRRSSSSEEPQQTKASRLAPTSDNIIGEDGRASTTERDIDQASETASGGQSAANVTEPSISTAVGHRRASSTISEMTELEQCKQMLLALERKLTGASPADDASSNTDGLAALIVGRNVQRVEFDQSPKTEISHIIPGFCKRTWPDLMNKMATDNEEWALEILMTDPEYRPKRHAGKQHAKREKLKGSEASRTAKESSIRDEPDSEHHQVPDRIRINSSLILKRLKSFDENIDETTPLIMLRPFKLLVHHSQAIREAVKHLKNEVTEPAAGQMIPGTPSTQSGTSTPGDLRESAHDISQHMSVLVDFMDTYIEPTVQRFAKTEDTLVRFDELWYLFKPGDDIIMPFKIQDTSINADSLGVTPETFHSRYNKLWRITSVSGGRLNIQNAQSRNADPRPNNFKVDCYYIDFHGRFFRPTVHTFDIVPFEGQVKVTELEFYPARFLKTAPVFDRNIERGKMVFESMAHSYNHFFYSGPTLMVHPCGCPMKDGPKIQEHIESEVIVDFKMTLRRHPNWTPQREPWKVPVAQPNELAERYPVRYWKDKKKSKVKRSEIDQVYDDYVIDRERALAFQKRETIFAPIPSGWLDNGSMVADNDVKLLPGRVFGFVLRTRTFSKSHNDSLKRSLTRHPVPLWLSALQPIRAQTEGLRNLQLKDNSFKDTLQALVKMHFRRKASQVEYEIVRGKGELTATVYGTILTMRYRARLDSATPWCSWSREDLYGW